MEDKKISEQESLLIIQQMIQTAKHEQKDDGIGWIMWGWLLFAASLLSWLNLQFRWFSDFLFWNLFGAITVVFILFQVVRDLVSPKKKRVKTYTGDLFRKLNAGFFIFLAIIIVSMNTGVPPVKGFALLLGLYGFWILIYGAALDFKPSIIGAYITWAFGIAVLFLRNDQFDITMLLHACAVMLGYIIPGHMANREFKKINRTRRV